MESALILTVWICLGVQAYHYVGFPAWLFLLARLRPRPWRTGIATTPPVTLVTAAHNEAAVIAEKLENALALDYPRLEIVVVSDGSTDATAALAEGFAARGVTVLRVPERRGKAHALNLGVTQARGDIVVVSDANALYERDALRRLVAPFADPAVGAVSGQARVWRADGTVGASEGLYWRYESQIKRWESRAGSTTGVVGAMLALRRELFPEIPPGIINDDVFLTLHVLRRGFRVLYEPAAVCWRRPSKSTRDEALRRRRITAGRCQQLLRLGAWPWRQPLAAFQLFSHKFLRLLLPLFMIGALAANLALLAVPPVPAAMQATLAAQLAFYGAALAGLVAERTGRRWRLPALAYYVTSGHLGSLAGLAAYLTGRQGVLWHKAAR